MEKAIRKPPIAFGALLAMAAFVITIFTGIDATMADEPVPPLPPEEVSLTTSAETMDVTVTWSAVDGAASYQVR